MKKSIHSILMSAMLMALPMMLTSCDLLFGEEDNPTVMTAFEEGALVEFTYPYNGTLHTSTFKKVGSNYVLQSAPLDAGELKAIEELVALNGNELLQFTVYLADSSDTEEEVDDSEFEIDDDDEDDGDDDENASRAFTRAISEETLETLDPVGIRIQLKTSTQSITTISINKAFGLGDGGAEETVTATISGKRTQKITVNNSKDKKYISVYYEGKKHTITFSENDTWTDVLNDYQESGLGDYLFVKDGKMMLLVEKGSGKKTKHYECWLKNGDSYVSPLDAVSSSKSYLLEKNMTNLKFFKDDYTVEDGEILTGTLKKKYHLIIPDGYTVTLYNATIKHGSKNSTTPAIECLGNATIIIADGTKNSVKTVVEHKSQTAITVPDNKYLIINGQINGTGKLSISGYAGVSAPSLSIEGGNTVICAKETGYNGEAGDGINVSGGTLDVKSKTANGIFGRLLVTGGKVTVGTSGSGVAAISGECSISGGTITAKAAKGVAIIGKVSASGGTLSATSKNTEKAIDGDISLENGMKLYEGDKIKYTTVAENQTACTKSCAVIKPASE